jgi:hypothetical protein
LGTSLVVALVAVSFTLVEPQTARAASISVTDNSIADWAGVQTFYDSPSEVSPARANIRRIYVTADSPATNLYLRMDIADEPTGSNFAGHHFLIDVDQDGIYEYQVFVELVGTSTTNAYLYENTQGDGLSTDEYRNDTLVGCSNPSGGNCTYDRDGNGPNASQTVSDSSNIAVQRVTSGSPLSGQEIAFEVCVPLSDIGSPSGTITIMQFGTEQSINSENTDDIGPDGNQQISIDVSDGSVCSVGIVIQDACIFNLSPDQPGYLVLRNTGTVTRSIAGYTLSDVDGNTFTIPAGYSLAPGATQVIVLGAEPSGNLTTAIFTGSGVAGMFNSSEDQIALYNESGTLDNTTLVDFLQWDNQNPISPSTTDDDIAVAAGKWTDGAALDIDNLAGQQCFCRASDGCDLQATGDFTPSAVTAAPLAAPRARATDSGVSIQWDGAAEYNNLGYRVMRGGAAQGPWTVVRSLVPGAVGGRPTGPYEIVDTGGAIGTWYRIDEIDRFGHSTQSAVFQATAPQAGDARLVSSSPCPCAREWYAKSSAIPDRKAAAGAFRQWAITTEQSGLTRVTLADLGLSSWPAGLLLRRADRVIPIRPDPVAGTIDFYASVQPNRHSDETVYFLAINSPVTSPTFSTRNATPSPTAGAPLTVYSTTDVVEENHLYDFGGPSRDPFFWNFVVDQLPAVDFDFSAALPVAGTPVSMKLNLTGLSSFVTVDPDHHALVSLNGTLVADLRWDGLGARTFNISLPASAVHADNTLTIQAVNDMGVAYDIYYLDYFELTYSRTFTVRDGELAYPAQTGRNVQVGGFASKVAAILDISKPDAPVLLTGVSMTQQGDGSWAALYFDGAKSTAFFAAEPAGLRRPIGVSEVVLANLRNDTAGAQSLILTSASLLFQAQQVAALHVARGISTKVVAVEDIYNEFGDGRPMPSFIKAYVTFALERWTTKPASVLLFGGTSYDPNDYMGSGAPNLIPANFFRSFTTGYEVAFDSYYVEAGSAMRIPIGRIPVWTTGEAQNAVAKLTAYGAGQAPVGQVAMVADDYGVAGPGYDGRFEADSLEAADALPDSVIAQQIWLRTSPNARAELLGAMAAGRDVINFTGHASPRMWTTDAVFTNADADALTNPHYFVMSSMTCYDGLFVDPWGTCLAWAALRNPSGGAIAAVSPATIIGHSRHLQWNIDVVNALYADYDSIGQAFQAARAAHLAKQPPFGLDLVRSYNLLGDPTVAVPTRGPARR